MLSTERLQALQARAYNEVAGQGLPTERILIQEMADGSGCYAIFIEYIDDSGERTTRIVEPAGKTAPAWARERYPGWEVTKSLGWFV